MSGNKVFVVDEERVKGSSTTIVPNAEKVEVDREAIKASRDRNMMNQQSPVEYPRRRGYLR